MSSSRVHSRFLWTLSASSSRASTQWLYLAFISMCFSGAHINESQLSPAIPLQILCQDCIALDDASGITTAEVQIMALHATGAMTLLNERFDPSGIRLIGRWKSNVMLRYLHIQAHNIMSGFSSIMLQGGNYALIPSEPGTALLLLG